MNTDTLLQNYTEKALAVMDEILSDNGLPSPENIGFEYNDISVVSDFHMGLNWTYLDKLVTNNTFSVSQVEAGDDDLVEALLEYNKEHDRKVERGLKHAREAYSAYLKSTNRVLLEVYDLAEKYYVQIVDSFLASIGGAVLNRHVARHEIDLSIGGRTHDIKQIVDKVSADLESGVLNLSAEKTASIIGLQRYFDHKLSNPEYFGIMFREFSEIVYDYLGLLYGNRYTLSDVGFAQKTLGQNNIKQVVEYLEEN